MWSRRWLLALVLSGGCGGSSHPSATATTAALARVEAAHLCAVSHQTFRTEAAIGDDLDQRLHDAGLDHDAWRRWHDSLVDSPARAAQLAAATEPGC